MANVDQRNKQEAWKGGSSQLSIGLTAAQAVAALDDPSATGGWYLPSYQLESAFGPSRDTEQVKDEADILIEQRIDRDEFEIVTTFFQTYDELFSLIEWMEDADNGVPLRYPLPTENPESTEMQWIFLYNANVVMEDRRVQAQRGANRTLQVTFRGSKDASGNIYAIVTLPNSQADAAWDDYAAFKDAALP